MTRLPMRAALWVVAVAFAAASATSIALSETVNHGFVAFALIIGGSFIATGLVALARRPENRFGLLLYAVGIAWFLSTLTTAENAYVFSIAQALSTVYYAVLVHAILAYPRGRLESRAAKGIVVAAYLDTLVPSLVVTLVGSSHDLTNDAKAPRNVLLVSHHPDLASGISNASAVVGIVLLAAVVAIVIQRWRAASAAARRVLAPVLATSGVALATIAIALIVEIAAGEAVGAVAFVVSSLAFASIPMGFLVGILRTSLSRSGALAELIDELSRSHEPGRVRRALRQAVGDPSLELAYWLGDLRVYVDAEGHPLDPARRPDRAVTIVERSGRRVAALIHDPALSENTELVETVGATAGLALENEQLQADLRARLGALEQSERRFRELLENVHLIAVSLDLDGRITFCNQYLADLAGYSREELIGRSWADMFNPADEAFVARVREGSINPHEEMFILTRSGERREIAWNNTLLRDDAGRLIGSTSIGEDVTERNRAARRLLLQAQVARALAGSPSMDVARPLVLAHLTVALGAWMGIFWRPAPDGSALTVDGVYLPDREHGEEFAAAVRGLRLAPGEGLAGRVWQSGQPAWVADVTASGPFPPLPAAQRDGRRGTLAFPIVSDGNVLLILQISSDDPTAPDPGTLEVLESTFQNVLQFAERREAEAAERRLAAEQAALRRVATLIAEGAEPERVFQSVTSEVGKLFGAQTTNMVQYRPEGTSATLLGGWTAGVATIAPGTVLELDGEAAISQIRETGRPVRIDDYTQLSGELAAQVRELGARAAVAAPIMVQGYLWGAMIVISNEGPFPPRTETRIAEFTDLVALALSSTDAHAQLTASRARIVEAGDAERRRLERNLHDGAQQRLVSLSLALRLARARLETDPGSANALLEAASEELATALEELRELARGIHPAILTDRGLAPALEAIAGRSAVPVEIHSLPKERLPAQVEAAAYYVVSESLANVAKYAGASRVDVSVVCQNGWALVEVADDGAGGADPGRGSGLLGLADRVEALAGNLDVESPLGAGTRVRARIPLA
jgi:PAS domain S-box-containing protein